MWIICWRYNNKVFTEPCETYDQAAKLYDKMSRLGRKPSLHWENKRETTQ